MRGRVIAYAEGARSRGFAVGRIARELGISPITLAAWLSGPLRQVEIVSEIEPVRRCEVTTPSGSEVAVFDARSGFKIEGLDLDSIIRLLERFR